VEYDLGSAPYAKNNISDRKLGLIFRFIMEQDYEVEYWAAMLLAWIAGCRAGTFTVSQGYGKGASLGDVYVPTQLSPRSLARFVRLVRPCVGPI